MRRIELRLMDFAPKTAMFEIRESLNAYARLPALEAVKYGLETLDAKTALFYSKTDVEQLLEGVRRECGADVATRPPEAVVKGWIATLDRKNEQLSRQQDAIKVRQERILVTH